jgi:hypothetical protein
VLAGTETKDVMMCCLVKANAHLQQCKKQRASEYNLIHCYSGLNEKLCGEMLVELLAKYEEKCFHLVWDILRKYHRRGERKGIFYEVTTWPY